jgi:hypothetical protein
MTGRFSLLPYAPFVDGPLAAEGGGGVKMTRAQVV